MYYDVICTCYVYVYSSRGQQTWKRKDRQTEIMSIIHQVYISTTRTTNNKLQLEVDDKTRNSVKPRLTAYVRKNSLRRINIHISYNKCLANAKRPCGCSVLCLRPKSSLCSCPHGPHYGRIVLFTAEFYQLTEQLLHVDVSLSNYFRWKETFSVLYFSVIS